MVVVRLQHQGIICSSGSLLRSVDSGTNDINYGGGGSGDAYTRESSSVWDDEW